MAFASAWTAVVQPPEDSSPNPISLEEWSQCGMPTGAPLYPWLRILPSWTISAPTESREQVALWDQAHATCIRTSISLGRSDMTHDLLDPKWDGTPTRASTEDAQGKHPVPRSDVVVSLMLARARLRRRSPTRRHREVLDPYAQPPEAQSERLRTETLSLTLRFRRLCVVLEHYA